MTDTNTKRVREGEYGHVFDEETERVGYYDDDDHEDDPKGLAIVYFKGFPFAPYELIPYSRLREATEAGVARYEERTRLQALPDALRG